MASDVKLASAMLEKVFLAADTVDPLYSMLQAWGPGKHTKRYACDLAEIVHVSCKVLDRDDAANAGDAGCLSSRDELTHKEGRQKKRTPHKEPALDLAVLAQPARVHRAARHLLIQPGRLEALWIGTAPADQFFIQRNAAGVEVARRQLDEGQLDGHPRHGAHRVLAPAVRDAAERCARLS